MAIIDLPVLSFNLTIVANDTGTISFSPKDSTGAGIDLTSAAFAMDAWLTTDSFGSVSANAIGPTIGLVSASAGKCVLKIGGVSAPGLYKGAITVTPSGGSQQLFANGTLTVN